MALNLSADFFLLAPDILKCILILSRNLPKHSQINSTDPKSIAIPSHVELRNQSPGTCVWICRCVVCRPPSSAYKDDSRRGGGILPGWWWRVANTLSTNFDAYLLECSHSEKKNRLNSKQHWHVFWHMDHLSLQPNLLFHCQDAEWSEATPSSTPLDTCWMASLGMIPLQEMWLDSRCTYIYLYISYTFDPMVGKW